MSSMRKKNNLHINGIFYSYSYDELPGFSSIWEQVREYSVCPDGKDSGFFSGIAVDSQPDSLLHSLEHPPDEEKLIQGEFEAAMRKKRKREAASGDSPQPEGGYQIKAGYVSLRERWPRLKGLIASVSEYFGYECYIQGDFYYPRGGFRGWHTNAYDRPGWRMYVVDVARPNASYFRFLHPKKRRIVTIWDTPGTVNFFRIYPGYLLWHCIRSIGTERWSKGFLVPDDWRGRIWRS